MFSRSHRIRYLFLSFLLLGNQALGITYTWDTITAAHSNRCLDVAAASKDNGAQIQQWDCHGGGNQRFLPEIRSQDNDSITIALKGLNSNKCLDVWDWGTDNGRKIVQWDCHYGNNQLWKVVPNGTNGFLLKSVHSGKCLDIEGIATGNGVRLVQWDCWNGNNQTFKFTRTLK